MKQTYKWGALVGLFIFMETVAGSKLDVFASEQAKSLLLVINLLTLGIGIYLALRDYKQKNGGVISFGRCMFNGVLISALAGIITALGAVLYYNYVFPEGKEKVLAESEKFFVQEKDTSATTVEEYEEHFIKNYQDTVHVTSADLEDIKKRAADSAEVIQNKINRTKGLFTFSGSVISYTGPFALIGIALSLLIAAVIAGKRPK